MKHIVQHYELQTLFLPSIQYRNNAFIALSCNTKESRHGHVKVIVRGITPPSIVVRRTEIGGGYGHSPAPKAPLRIKPVVAHYLVASTTCHTTSEKCTTNSCCVHSKPSVEGVIIATSSTYILKSMFQI